MKTLTLYNTSTLPLFETAQTVPLNSQNLFSAFKNLHIFQQTSLSNTPDAAGREDYVTRTEETCGEE